MTRAERAILRRRWIAGAASDGSGRGRRPFLQRTLRMADYVTPCVSQTCAVRLRSKRGRDWAVGLTVGATVELAPYQIVGIIVDLVLDEDLQDVRYVVVAFDGGPAEPVLYQPIRSNLLYRKSLGEFCVNAADDALEAGMPLALITTPVAYGGNARRSDQTFAPTPLSFRLH